MSTHDQGSSEARGAGRTIALALQRKPPRLECELAAAVADELARLGAECHVVEDGDVRAMEATDLWLISDAASYVRYPWIFRRRSIRPRTMLWQMHPLPPLELPAEAERIGLEAAGVGNELRRRAERVLRGFAHWPSCRHWLSRRYWRRTDAMFGQSIRVMHAQPDWPWPPLDIGSVRGMMERDLCIRDGVGPRGWLDRVCVSTMGRAEYLRRGGIDAVFVPIGWHASFGGDPGEEGDPGDQEVRQRDLDVLFVGRVAPGGRRAHLLQQIERELAEAGFTLHRAESDCYGDDRAAMLSRARIVLNLNKYPWDAPWLRFVMAAGCGAAVISESLPPSDAEPWRAGTQYLASPPESLGSTLIDLLRDPARLAAIRRAAAAHVRGPLTMSAAVRTLLHVSAAARDRRG